jgi:hypothetical protein
LYLVPAAARTPRAAQLERGTEVTVNAIMGFQVMALIWLGLTVAAAIAGGIAH